MATCTEARRQATPLWLTPMQDNLLRAAEMILTENECENHCVHHAHGRGCWECPNLSVPVESYIVCEGYRQKSEVDAA